MLSDPDVLADVSRWQKISKEHSELSPIAEKYREYKKVTDELDSCASMLENKSEPLDSEMRELIVEEIDSLKKQKSAFEDELPVLLLPKDPNDEKNVIVEIRGGVGGEEAALFAGDLFRMYTRYAESH